MRRKFAGSTLNRLSREFRSLPQGICSLCFGSQLPVLESWAKCPYNSQSLETFACLFANRVRVLFMVNTNFCRNPMYTHSNPESLNLSPKPLNPKPATSLPIPSRSAWHNPYTPLHNPSVHLILRYLSILNPYTP